jgi:hypothetical protein
MSDLVYQNYNNRCRGWTNPSNLVFGPQIGSLSSYYSPSGSTNLVSITGSYFFSYSSLSFGTTNPTIYFINSNNIQFYVPTTLSPGTYTVQVFNGSTGSNIVNYTIDNSYSYWIANNKNISNTNSSLVSVTSLSRGAPFTITGDLYTVPDNLNWFICNQSTNTNTNMTITLPDKDSYNGREVMFKNISTGLVVSNSSNISYDGKKITNIILPGTNADSPYPWTTLVYNFANNIWISMQSNF